MTDIGTKANNPFVDPGDETHKQEYNSEKNPPPRIILALAAAIVVLIGLFIAYLIGKPCPLGQYKDKVILCKFYRTFGDVPLNELPRKEFKYGGSTAAVKLAGPVKDQISQVYPSFQWNYERLRDEKVPGEVFPWSGEGIQALITGNLDVAFSSRDLINEELEKAKQQGVELESIPIAKSGLVFFVTDQNASLIPRLTLEQLKKIYTEQGPTLEKLGISSDKSEIKPFSPDPVDNPGQPEYFQSNILEGADFSPSVINPPSVDTISNLIRVLKDTQELGIGFADASIVCPETEITAVGVENNGTVFLPCLNTNPGKPHNITIADGTYPLTRELFAIIRRDGTVSERAGEAYVNMLLSDAGQVIVTQVGYVPTREISTQ